MSLEPQASTSASAPANISLAQNYAKQWRQDESYAKGFAKGAAVACDIFAKLGFMEETARIMLLRAECEPGDIHKKASHLKRLKVLCDRCAKVDVQDQDLLLNEVTAIEKLAKQANIYYETSITTAPDMPKAELAVSSTESAKSNFPRPDKMTF